MYNIFVAATSSDDKFDIFFQTNNINNFVVYSWNISYLKKYQLYPKVI